MQDENRTVPADESVSEPEANTITEVVEIQRVPLTRTPLNTFYAQTVNADDEPHGTPEDDLSRLHDRLFEPVNTETVAAPETEHEAPDEVNRVAVAKNEVYDWVQCVVSTVVVLMLVFFCVARQISVIGSSMLQTLHEGDRVIVSDLFFTPKYGDIVVIKTEYFGETPIVKRVIATEGQTINIDFDAHIVYVDGDALSEPYINELTVNREDFNGPLVVPQGCVFVMGDNRNHSTDSRSRIVGFVDTRTIIGKVWLIVFPGADVYGRRDWSRLGSPY